MINLELDQQQAQALMGILSQVPTGYEMYPLYLDLKLQLQDVEPVFSILKAETQDEQEENL